ncbi:MAG TPA: hypothetical protein VFS43_01340 [Polyangiaceae bacterium]|nr:hypothetical protein [Polyangiaceae bacterium]
MPTLLDSLPALYRGLFPAFFEGEQPAEAKATCGSCAMSDAARHGRVEPVDGVRRLFRSDTKCCTYHPRLPNYLVGALLAGDEAALAEGRRRVRERLAGRVGVTPQWLKAPATYSLLYSHGRGAFGRAESLVCPYFDRQGGGCTVWAYREAVCSTFFCKYVAGADGIAFWTSLKTYLTIVELQLSRYALFRLYPEYILAGHDRPDPEGGPLSAEDLDGAPPPEGAYRRLWGEWAGREEAFYLAAHDAVRALARADFERVMGLDGDLTLAVLERRRAAALSPALPERLRFNPDATVKWLDDGSVALGAYSGYDAVALPGEAYALLVAFRGDEPVKAVRERLRQTRGADLDDEVLLVLYRHRVLVDAAEG